MLHVQTRSVAIVFVTGRQTAIELFAVVQLGVALGYPLIGLIGGVGILGIYWYSGYFGDLVKTLLDHRDV